MRKVISCKVIRTIPLVNNNRELRNKVRSDVKSHNINNSVRIPNTNQRMQETSVNNPAKSIKKTVIYTKQLDITRISIENGYSASTLNCYI